MPILTDLTKISGLSLNDFVHIADPTDLSQGPNGSSYKATIGQLIDSEGCCLTSGVYVLSAGTINFYGITNQIEFSATGIFQFTGGSGSCINNFYLNEINPCIDNIVFHPQSTNGRSTFFGSGSAISGLTLSHLINTQNIGFTKLRLNAVSTAFTTRSTVEFLSYDKKTSYMLYDDLVSASPTFVDFQEVITISFQNTVSHSIHVHSNNQCGIIIGNINSSDNSNGQYGVTSDSFISTTYSANGINFISTNSGDTSGYIRFWAGGAPDGMLTPVIHIDGTDPTKGFMLIGQQNVSPTSWVDIVANTSTSYQIAYGYDQLRLRTSYTPTGGTDSNGNVGEIAWDNSYLYVKSSISPHTWNRLLLSTF
jgi:hypothetical protein